MQSPQRSLMLPLHLQPYSRVRYLEIHPCRPNRIYSIFPNSQLRKGSWTWSWSWKVVSRWESIRGNYHGLYIPPLYSKVPQLGKGSCGGELTKNGVESAVIRPQKKRRIYQSELALGRALYEWDERVFGSSQKNLDLQGETYQSLVVVDVRGPWGDMMLILYLLIHLLPTFCQY